METPQERLPKNTRISAGIHLVPDHIVGGLRHVGSHLVPDNVVPAGVVRPPSGRVLHHTGVALGLERFHLVHEVVERGGGRRPSSVEDVPRTLL